MDTVFEIATRVSTPLALGGFFAAALFLIFRQIVARNIFPRLTQALGADILKTIIERLFFLALVAMILGFVAFILTQVYVPAVRPLLASPSPESCVDYNGIAKRCTSCMWSVAPTKTAPADFRSQPYVCSQMPGGRILASFAGTLEVVDPPATQPDRSRIRVRLIGPGCPPNATDQRCIDEHARQSEWKHLEVAQEATVASGDSPEWRLRLEACETDSSAGQSVCRAYREAGHLTIVPLPAKK